MSRQHLTRKDPQNYIIRECLWCELPFKAKRNDPSDRMHYNCRLSKNQKARIVGEVHGNGHRRRGIAIQGIAHNGR